MLPLLTILPMCCGMCRVNRYLVIFSSIYYLYVLMLYTHARTQSHTHTHTVLRPTMVVFPRCQLLAEEGDHPG